MHAGMIESHLTSLALMHIHCEHSIKMDTVIQPFAELYPRRLQLGSVLFESIISYNIINPRRKV